MAFRLGGGRKGCGEILDQLENELSQMIDETAPLLRRELLIDGWSRMGLCTPQFQLRPLHVGSPELASFVLWSDRLRSGAANSQHAGAAATSPMHKPQSSRVPPNSVASRQSRSRPRECKSGCRQAGRGGNAVFLGAAASRTLRAPCLRGHGAGGSPGPCPGGRGGG